MPNPALANSQSRRVAAVTATSGRKPVTDESAVRAGSGSMTIDNRRAKAVAFGVVDGMTFAPPACSGPSGDLTSAAGERTARTDIVRRQAGERGASDPRYRRS